MKSILRRLHCPHSRLDGIYGDEINHVGGYRLQCLDCHAFIHGPVSLAQMRRAESQAA